MYYLYVISLSVNYTTLGQGRWTSYSPIGKERELAVVRIISEKINKKYSDNNNELKTNYSDESIINFMINEDNNDIIDVENISIDSDNSSSSLLLSSSSSSIIPLKTNSFYIHDDDVENHSSSNIFITKTISSIDIISHNDNHSHNDDDDDDDDNNFQTTNFDEDFVNKQLGEINNIESNLVIGIFDFGGQEVFDSIHHLFLTKYGVYLIVFNMEWLNKDGPDKDKDKCIDYIRSWLNSIAVHTFENKKTAPIFLIGTHQDIIKETSDHLKISKLLYQEFHDSTSWEFIIYPDHNNELNFWVVDNKINRENNQLMIRIEEVINKSDYVKKDIPITWLHMMDELTNLRKKNSYLTMIEIKKIAKSCNVKDNEIPLLLRFLNEMGILLWVNEDNIRNVIILDAVEYLIKPATLVICNHVDTSERIHFSPIHQQTLQNYKVEWSNLTKMGVLSIILLETLWKDINNDKKDILLQLMCKFGLLVKFYNESNIQYLAPSLLPICDNNDFPMIENWSKKLTTSCYFFLTNAIGFKIKNKSFINFNDAITFGFVPPGLFSRLISKVVDWLQNVSKFYFDSISLKKNCVVLGYGSINFRLKLIVKLNCIQLDIEGTDIRSLKIRIEEHINNVISECLNSLLCIPTILFNNDINSISNNDYLNQPIQNNKDLLLISYEHIESLYMNEQPLRMAGVTLVAAKDIENCFISFLNVKSALSEYDLYISYRWGLFDSKFTSSLFDIFVNYTLKTIDDDNDRVINCFLDKIRLPKSKNIVDEFSQSLISSKLFVPIISKFSLKGMIRVEKTFDHDPNKVDNLLLELIIAYTCQQIGYKEGWSRLEFVRPILFGSITTNGVHDIIIKDLFLDGFPNNLSEEYPLATINKAKEIFLSNSVDINDYFNIEFSSKTMTIKSFILKFTSCNCCETWKLDYNDITKIVAIDCYKILNDNNNYMIAEEKLINILINNPDVLKLIEFFDNCGISNENQLKFAIGIYTKKIHTFKKMEMMNYSNKLVPILKDMKMEEFDIGLVMKELNKNKIVSSPTKSDIEENIDDKLNALITIVQGSQDTILAKVTELDDTILLNMNSNNSSENIDDKLNGLITIVQNMNYTIDSIDSNINKLKSLTTLIEMKGNMMPITFIIKPKPVKNKLDSSSSNFNKFRNFVRRKISSMKSLFWNELLLVFICPVTGEEVPCGPIRKSSEKREGYKIKISSDLLKSLVPSFKLCFSLLRVAISTTSGINIPELHGSLNSEIEEYINLMTSNLTNSFNDNNDELVNSDYTHSLQYIYEFIKQKEIGDASITNWKPSIEWCGLNLVENAGNNNIIKYGLLIIIS
jgi:hypothetical protein